MKLALYKDPTAVYSKNNAFWRELSNTAVHVSVADEAPSKWEMAKDSIKDSVKKLPDTIKGGAKKVASEVADLAGSAAHAVGKVANEAGKGLFSGFGTPLLIGAGLIGLFLVSRATRDEKKEA